MREEKCAIKGHYSSIPCLDKTYKLFALDTIIQILSEITKPLTSFMFSPILNLYHPFTDSSLGIFLAEKSIQKDTHGCIFEDIDLNHQPLPKPEIAIILVFIKLCLVSIGLFVYVKVWFLIKNEKSISTQVVKVYIMALIVLCPYWLIFTTIIDFIHPVDEVIGLWFCTLGKFIIYFCFIIVAFNSFIVAFMRYVFIVHEEKVKQYGKEKVKKFFLIISLLFPLLLNIWRTIDAPAKDPMSIINKCYGNHHVVFLMESSASLAGEGFCPSMAYADGDVYSMFTAFVGKCSCIVRVLIVFILGFNFTEGYLYFKIFAHMKK